MVGTVILGYKWLGGFVSRVCMVGLDSKVCMLGLVSRICQIQHSGQSIDSVTQACTLTSGDSHFPMGVQTTSKNGDSVVPISLVILGRGEWGVGVPISLLQRYCRHSFFIFTQGDCSNCSFKTYLTNDKTQRYSYSLYSIFATLSD